MLLSTRRPRRLRELLLLPGPERAPGDQGRGEEDLHRWEDEGGNVPPVATPSPAPVPQAPTLPRAIRRRATDGAADERGRRRRSRSRGAPHAARSACSSTSWASPRRRSRATTNRSPMDAARPENRRSRWCAARRAPARAASTRRTSTRHGPGGDRARAGPESERRGRLCRRQQRRGRGGAGAEGRDRAARVGLDHARPGASPTAWCSTSIPIPPCRGATSSPRRARTRDVLSDLGLDSFVKTSGGKGLHVMVPLAAEARLGRSEGVLARGRRVHRRRPARAASPRRWRRRSARGRIFIDYLRNAPAPRRSRRIRCARARARRYRRRCIGMSSAAALKPAPFHAGNVARRLQGLHSDPWKTFRRTGADPHRHHETQAGDRRHDGTHAPTFPPPEPPHARRHAAPAPGGRRRQPQRPIDDPMPPKQVAAGAATRRPDERPNPKRY